MKWIKRQIIKWIVNDEEFVSTILQPKSESPEQIITDDNVSDNDSEEVSSQDDSKLEVMDEFINQPPITESVENETIMFPPENSPSQSEPVLPEETSTFAIDAGDWIIVGTSVIGKGHISANMPCQDNHKYEYLSDGWGIAITSDGAGSAENSHIGSKLIAECGAFRYKSIIKRENWIAKNELPTDAEWQRQSYLTMKAVRDDMDSFAKKHNIALKSLNATAIVLIHSPCGILAAHIGDGRAGYKNEEGEWKALIKPHKGEEASQTVFLNDDYWFNNYPYVLSRVLVPETVVVREKPIAFTLMSDGCEKTAWQCYQKDEKTGIYFDPNNPHPPFFNPLCVQLQSFRNDKVDCEVRKEKWEKFIVSGNQSLEKEKDDKTMILGVLNK